MAGAVTKLESLYKVRKGAVDIVDVPELGCAMVDGVGPPDGAEFAAAVQALYAVSYGAHFLVKKQRGEAPKVMPPEAQWWVDEPDQQDIIMAAALGQASIADTDRERWRWRAMIVQAEPTDADAVARAVEQARAKQPSPARGHRGCRLSPPRPAPRDLPRRPAPQRPRQAADDPASPRRADHRRGVISATVAD